MLQSRSLCYSPVDAANGCRAIHMFSRAPHAARPIPADALGSGSSAGAVSGTAAGAEALAEEAARTAIRRGDDRGAVALLVRTYGPAVYRYCRTMIGEADAEDLMQITFLHAQRSLASTAAMPSIKGWLLGIARHRCLDKIRAERRRPRADFDTDEVMELPAQVTDVQAVLAERRAGAEIDDCLDALEPRIRAAVLMRYQDQLSYDEIAGETGEKAVTLRVRVSRALPALRRCLEAKGVEL